MFIFIRITVFNSWGFFIGMDSVFGEMIRKRVYGDDRDIVDPDENAQAKKSRVIDPAFVNKLSLKTRLKDKAKVHFFI